VDIKDLRVFRAVAQEGSISKAAQSLNYVQSNVSARMQALEEELGATLLYRHNRGISLTTAGQRLLDYSERILHLFDEAFKAMQDTGVPSGTLTVGSIDEAAAIRLPPLLASYHRAYPEVDIQMVTGITAELTRRVLDYEVEGAFVNGPIDHPELVSIPVIEEELVLVTPPSQGTISSWDDLEVRTYIVMMTRCLYRGLLEEWLAETEVPPMKVMEIGTWEGILNCVSAGLGFTLLSRSFVARWEESGAVACHRLPGRSGKMDTVFIYRKDVYMSAALRAFLDVIREHKWA
jgi:DNA-binding transcriptional LysR family regulator